MSKGKHKHWDGNIHIWKWSISMNTVLTSVFGMLCCAGVGWGLKQLSTVVHNSNHIYQNFSMLESTVESIKKEQERIKKEYAPPLPSPTP